MKSQPQATKAKAAKIEAMKKIKAAYIQAKSEGRVKSYRKLNFYEGGVSMTFREHIQDRGGGFCKHRINCFVDSVSEVITFPLWTTNGKLVGYQRYDWRADKLRNNSTKGKYYTYRDKNILSCWGVDCNDLTSTEDLFVVEGVWDAISVLNTGRRCVAVLSNNPQNLKVWFRTLPCKTIALCDGDKAGKMLSKVCDKSIILPDGVDCNDMDLTTLDNYLKEKT